MKDELLYLTNPQDKKIMQSYFSLSEATAELLGEHCEVVIHSITNFESSIIKIINGYHTGRKVGDPITDKGLQLLKFYYNDRNNEHHCYFSHLSSGDLIKSTTHIIIGSQGNPIGLFCINLNLSYPFDKVICSLMPKFDFLTPQRNENFTTNSQELIESTLNEAIQTISKTIPPDSKSYTKAVVSYLFETGIFELKDTVSQVAQRLNITNHAIYKHIRELKNNK
ncbi:hypothetical protein A4G18_04255 [Pasteurellaceae bacterium Pebbles2]|nr:hypothetical protein [Pasteurellaceae bacterium Pebbles2]